MSVSSAADRMSCDEADERRIRWLGWSLKRLLKSTASSHGAAFLLAMCLHGCNADPEKQPGKAERRSAPLSESPAPATLAEPDPASKRDFLIDAYQVGRARLDMAFGDLKNLFPQATFHIVSVRTDKTFDIAVREQGRDFLFVRTKEMDETTVDELPQSNDPVRSLMTGDTRYATAAGVRPGQTLGEAVKAYGTPELFYQPPTEFAAFRPEVVKNLAFYLIGSGEGRPAGIYAMTKEAMEDNWYKSDRAHSGSRISYIAVVDISPR